MPLKFAYWVPNVSGGLVVPSDPGGDLESFGAVLGS